MKKCHAGHSVPFHILSFAIFLWLGHSIHLCRRLESSLPQQCKALGVQALGWSSALCLDGDWPWWCWHSCLWWSLVEPAKCMWWLDSVQRPRKAWSTVERCTQFICNYQCSDFHFVICMRFSVSIRYQWKIAPFRSMKKGNMFPCSKHQKARNKAWKGQICFLPPSVTKSGTRHGKGKYVSFL